MAYNVSNLFIYNIAIIYKISALNFKCIGINTLLGGENKMLFMKSMGLRFIFIQLHMYLNVEDSVLCYALNYLNLQ